MHSLREQFLFLVVFPIVAAGFVPSAVASDGVLSYRSSALTQATAVTLRRSGPKLVLTDDVTHRVLVSAPAATTRKFVMRGLDGPHDDTLTVDVTGISLPEGIDYDGGLGGFDSLNLVGTGVRRTTQDPVAGILWVDDLQIRYANLEPITDSTAAATLTITGTAAAEAISITDGAAGFTRVQIGANEYIDFQNKTAVTIDGGGGGDTVTINNPNPAAGWTTLLLTNVGTVSQTGPLKVPNVAVNATGDVSLDWVNPVTFVAENLISAFAANSSGGSVSLITIGPMQVTTILGVTGITTPTGVVNIHMARGGGQDLTINSNISAGGGTTSTTALWLEAPGSLLTNNASISATTQSHTWLAAGKMNLNPGTVNAGAGSVTLDFLAAFGPIGGPIDIGSTTDTATNTLELSNAELNTITADSIVIGDLPYLASAITISNPISLLHANFFGLFSQGGYTATGSGSVTVPNFFISDFQSSTPRTWTISGTSVTVSPGNPIPYTATSALFNGSLGSDTFNVTPSATVPITVSGFFPNPPTLPGDTLNVNVSGTTSPVLTKSSSSSGLSGNYTFGNRQTVTFDSMETLVGPDLAVAKTVSGTDQAGNATYAITLSNNGAAATNVALTDPLPAGSTFVSLAQTSGPAFSCTTPAVGFGGTVTCTIASFAPGGAAAFTLVLQRGTLATISNTATASDFEPDVNTANDAATATASFAFSATSIPTLGEWEMMLLALTVALFGLFAIKRA